MSNNQHRRRDPTFRSRNYAQRSFPLLFIYTQRSNSVTKQPQTPNPSVSKRCDDITAAPESCEEQKKNNGAVSVASWKIWSRRCPVAERAADCRFTPERLNQGGRDAPPIAPTIKNHYCVFTDVLLMRGGGGGGEQEVEKGAIVFHLTCQWF